jgi:ribosomal protein S27E
MEEDVKNIEVEEETTDKKVVDTSSGKDNGQDKCPKCGSTDISPTKDGKLRCNFCRHIFEPVKVEGLVDDISMLEGEVMGSALKDIQADTKDVITIKCSSCGAEVVIDSSSSTQARCHWCRNTLSINEQIPNGAVPDVVLPFSITKEEARASIEKFVGKRKFFAHPKFRKEFTTENIMGVYFPYMLVDVNAHSNMSGEGEHLKRSYTVGTDNNRRTYYDADSYHVEREFDIAIEGLSIESSSDRLNNASKEKTNNIINSIMPFDTENCVKYNANYLKGFTSEKRDTNVDQIKELVYTQAKDVARFAANDTLKTYDRGVAWDKEDFKVKGSQCQAAYLPVWLYSYQQVKGNKKLLHYAAVNARTKETMGSVPIHMPKLIITSIFVQMLSFITMWFVNLDDMNWIYFLPGLAYFFVMYARYRNSGARHTYELETKRKVSNLRQVDDFIKTKKGLSNSSIEGRNNDRVEGTTNSKSGIDKITKNTLVNVLADQSSLGGALKKKIDKKQIK